MNTTETSREQLELSMNEIFQKIKDLYPNTTTRIKIVITADNTTIQEEHRSPEQLKKSGYSMRNIKGDFIK